MDTKIALRDEIKGAGVSISFIARVLGISRTAFYKKLNGKTEFKAVEIKKICEALHLSAEKREDIFFAK